MLRITITHGEYGTWHTYSIDTDSEAEAIDLAKDFFWTDYCKCNADGELPELSAVVTQGLAACWGI